MQGKRCKAAGCDRCRSAIVFGRSNPCRNVQPKKACQGSGSPSMASHADRQSKDLSEKRIAKPVKCAQTATFVLLVAIFDLKNVK